MDILVIARRAVMTVALILAAASLAGFVSEAQSPSLESWPV
jgi:hypothetical protein